MSKTVIKCWNTRQNSIDLHLNIKEKKSNKKQEKPDWFMWHLKSSLNQLQIGRRGGDWYKRIQDSMHNSRKVELQSLLINCICQCSERKTSLVHNEEKQHSTTQKPLAGITNTLDYWTWIPNENLAQDRAECRPYAYHAGNLMCLWNFIRWHPSTIRTYCQVRFKCHNLL